MPSAVSQHLRRAATDGGRGLLLALTSVTANVVLLVLSVVALVLTVAGVGLVALPAVTALVRRLTGLNRRLAAGWSGTPIPTPYRPRPPGWNPWRRYRWVVTDPATWRDLLWLLLSIPVGLVIGLLPLCLALYGVQGLIGIPALVWSLDGWYGYGAVWPIENVFDAALTVPQGGLIVLASLFVGRHLRWLHAWFIRALLGPTRAAALAHRVDRLTESRSDAVDAQAAELRRIERDLHDGAQARLVALSMNIGLAEKLMARDPEAAQRLLVEARQESGRALVDLRDLVRGIHPPLLAERGLDGAVRALAFALPLTVDVDIDLPGPAPAPVESAAYFAMAEVLANVAKHSGAPYARVRLAHHDGKLVMAVRDHGVGGADPAGGTGLRGIQRRLAAFDGTMSVASPPGGPTVVTMELPCALSSPKTSPSSGTG
nr:sensor histidine kinase [Micromonospora sp. DSM 115978]